MLERKSTAEFAFPGTCAVGILTDKNSVQAIPQGRMNAFRQKKLRHTSIVS